MTEINVSQIPANELLAKLYNSSRVQGLGFLQAINEEMTPEHATSLLDGKTQYFDYLHGKIMKVEINGTMLNSALYDRDNGPGAAQAVVDSLLDSQS